MSKILFWVSFLAIFYTYIGYPVLITVIAKLIRRKPVSEISHYPTVSIVIPVFNEEDVIKEKLENCLNLNYPKDRLEILIGSDGSTDGTDEILRRWRDEGRRTRDEGRITRDEGRSKVVRVFYGDERKGKPNMINRLVREAKGEILFFTDARQMIEKGALIKLVRNFQDEKIGCVSGELLYQKGKSITRRGVGAYWEYEKYLREKESDIYSMIGATGAIYACRKELFEPLPENVILDDVYTPLVVVKKGYRAIFDRDAKAYDVVAAIPREEHKRKMRTLSGNYQIFFQMPHMLNPFKSKLALQIISHKLFRVLIPFFMIMFFLSNLFLLGKPFYTILFIAQSLFYLTALTEALFRRHIKKIFGIPYLFCLLNFSALVGLWNFIFNRIDIKWGKAR